MKCDIKVKKILSCGHTLEKKCYEQFNCIEICDKLNSNCLFRHLCKKPCGVNCGLCTYPIPIIMKCGHISELSCSQEPNTVECLECKEGNQIPPMSTAKKL
ncbi:uncharacterized protein LOC115034685 [Acyrthosiphon pisum]|uniref:Uncharacterized protein n=1 Tax=Acyrthosiphon pisum TaxID=7029 RepID=A0A8R2NTK9_ACYPI|nr:uncharacterized protein LOC115034685 [Acyrthosiphon pisum]